MSAAAGLSAAAPKGRASVGQDRDQALAVTFAVLLLTGSVLFVSCWVGQLATFGAVAVLVVSAYAAPGVARRLAVRCAVCRLLRGVPGA